MSGTFSFTLITFDYSAHPDYTNLGGIEIDCGSDILYGYAWDSANSEEVFVSIDPSDGVVSYLATIPGINTVHPISTYNDDEYFAVMRDTQGVINLVQVSISSTYTVSVIPFDYTNTPNLELVGGIEYDGVNDVLYGFAFDNSNDDIYSVSIDPSGGMVTELGLISTGPVSVTALSTTFDGTNYYIGIRNDQGDRLLGTITVDTFSVTLTAITNPATANVMASFAGFEIESSNGLIYGYGWDTNNEEELFVSFDPSTGTMTSIGVLTGITLTTSTSTYVIGNFYAIMAGSPDKTQYLIHIQI
jgi:hypothetical protein